MAPLLHVAEAEMECLFTCMLWPKKLLAYMCVACEEKLRVLCLPMGGNADRLGGGGGNK